MSNRKENLKKSLGITEYPWSSDDDDNPRTYQDQLPASRYLESITPVSGSSGAVTSSSAISPTRRNSTRLERDLYRSLQDNPSIINVPVTPSRSRNSNILAFTTLTPNLEDIFWPLSREDNPSTNEEGTAPGRRRNLDSDTTQPSAGNTSNLSPTRRNQPEMERTYWSESNQNNDSGPSRSRDQSGARDLRLMQAINRLTRNFRPQFVQRGGASRNVVFNPSMQTNVTAALGTIRLRRRPSHRAPLPSTRSRSISPVIGEENSSSSRNNHEQAQNTEQEQNSDDDSDPPVRSTFVIEENNVNNNENIEENNSDSNIQEPESMDMDISESVQLEEDVVEVNGDGVEENRGDDNDNGNDVEVLAENEDEHKEPTAQSLPPQLSQKVKRRRETRENVDPETVKEFNQCLLGLLECPVCLECMEPPMSQCRRGHLVCWQCRARLSACPVCRTTFSSVRNRAMEAVAELLRYPCRHECGHHSQLRRRAEHEASCAARRYRCPASPCTARAPLPLPGLAAHARMEHLSMLKLGCKHKFSVRVNRTHFENWFVMVGREIFHLRIDVEIRTGGVVVYVAYIGPKCNASRFVYEVTVTGEHNRKLVYTRATHSDLESSSLNISRQDCFHLPLDQVHNFLNLRKIKHNTREFDKFLDFTVDISKCEEPVESVTDEPDS